MPLELLAAAAGAGGVFSYNRENYFFDKQQQIKLEYQAQEMKIRQFELYREDVRDLVNLTIGKMEKYLIVNTLLLGFCFTLFSEGRPEPGTQFWLVCLFCLCNAGAFLYYLLSMWLAMHASVSAHAFGVRLLTQFVRLPVPNVAELDQAVANAQEYEGLRLKDLLRIPVWRQQLRRMEAAMEDSQQEQNSDAGSEVGDSMVEATDPAMQSVAMMKHVQMFRKLQANWQSYDAYARVCMAMGTHQLLHTLSYCTLCLLVHQNDVPVPAVSCVVIFMAGAFVLGKLDLYLSRNILAVAATLLILPPVLAVTSMMALKHGPRCWVHFHKILIVIVYVLHIVWIGFTVFVARGNSFRGVSLPTKFRSVLFLDVFGWLAEDEDDEAERNNAENEWEGHSALSPVAEDQHASICEESERGSLPENMQPIVLSACKELQQRVCADLLRWESQEVSQLLEGSRAEQKELQRLRRLFNAVAHELHKVTGAADDSPETAPQEELPVYLQLEWNPEGDTMLYYYQCETGETIWEAPQEHARISELQSLERDVGELYSKFRLLGRCMPAITFDSQVASSSQSSVSPSSPSGERLRASSSAQQEVAPSRSQAATQEQHLPGLLPWRTVLKGSQALLGVWLLAAGAEVLSLLGIIQFSFERPLGEDLTQLQPHFISLVDIWPHRFPSPVGLACSPQLGAVAFMAERYRVQEIRIERGHVALQRSNLTSALERCSKAAGRIWHGGLADVGLDCSSWDAGRSCSVVMLAAKGQQAVRCPLEADGEPSSLELLGGPWRALAPASAGQLWALGDGRAPALLGPAAGDAGRLRPQLDLLEGVATDIVALHVLRNETLLCLESSGRLHAMPLAGGPVHSWSLPEAEGTAWTGVCATGEQLLFACRSTGGAGSVWQMALPPELRSLAHSPVGLPDSSTQLTQQ